MFMAELRPVCRRHNDEADADFLENLSNGPHGMGCLGLRGESVPLEAFVLRLDATLTTVWTGGPG